MRFIRDRFASVLIAALAASGACKKSEDKPAEQPSGSPKAGDQAPSPGAGATTTLELSAAGPAWKGWTVKAPDGAKVSDDGAGGAVIATPSFQITILQGDMHLDNVRSGLVAGGEPTKTKFTFAVDKPTRLEWTSETETGIKGYGFAYYVPAAHKAGCRTTVDDREQLVAAKALCNSLAAQ